MCGVSNGFDTTQRLLHDTFGLSFQVAQDSSDTRTNCTTQRKMEEEQKNEILSSTKNSFMF